MVWWNGSSWDRCSSQCLEGDTPRACDGHGDHVAAGDGGDCPLEEDSAGFPPGWALTGTVVQTGRERRAPVGSTVQVLSLLGWSWQDYHFY